MGVAICSYDGTLGFGITGDGKHATDIPPSQTASNTNSRTYSIAPPQPAWCAAACPRANPPPLGSLRGSSNRVGLGKRGSQVVVMPRRPRRRPPLGAGRDLRTGRVLLWGRRESRGAAVSGPSHQGGEQRDRARNAAQGPFQPPSALRTAAALPSPQASLDSSSASFQFPPNHSRMLRYHRTWVRVCSSPRATVSSSKTANIALASTSRPLAECGRRASQNRGVVQ